LGVVQLNRHPFREAIAILPIAITTRTRIMLLPWAKPKDDSIKEQATDN